MSRKKKKVCQCFQPVIKKYIPFFSNEKIGSDESQVLYRNELEAIKLHDVDGLSHQEAANHMGISQPTFSRLLTGSYQTIAQAIVNGHEIHVLHENTLE